MSQKIELCKINKVPLVNTTYRIIANGAISADPIGLEAYLGFERKDVIFF